MREFVFFRYITMIILVATASLLKAQQMYVTEIGIHGGGSLAQIDAGQATPLQSQESFGVTLRYLFNQRISLISDWSHTSIKGSVQHRMPDFYPGNFDINQRINMLDLGVAFNFLDYGKVDNILRSSDISTYLMTGIGLIDNSGVLRPDGLYWSIPVAFGVKYKLTKKVHLSFQLTHRWLRNFDGLEGIAEFNNPAGLNGNNFFRNDQMTTASVAITLNMFRKKCDCMNYQ